MGILANKYFPVLRRIRVFIDSLRDHLSKSSPLGDPLASEAADRMPTNLNWAKWSIDDRLGQRDYIGRLSQTHSVFQS